MGRRPPLDEERKKKKGKKMVCNGYGMNGDGEWWS
jgi:hypothetical protein